MDKLKRPIKYFIIVDENNRPMSWAVNQLCYCNDETWQDTPHLLTAYPESWAKRHIAASIEYRKDNGLSESTYKLMEFRLPTKFRPYNK